MATKQQTSKEYFKLLQIIFYAFLAGQVMFGMIVLFLVQTQNLQPNPDLVESFMYVVPIVAFTALVIGNIVYKKVLAGAKNKTLLVHKMPVFMSATLVKCAMLEGTTLFTIVTYLLTGEVMFIGAAALLIVIFYTFKPSREKAIMDLELSHEDIETINNPEAVISELNSDRR
jgi:hypothetical protein